MQTFLPSFAILAQGVPLAYRTCLLSFPDHEFVHPSQSAETQGSLFRFHVLRFLSRELRFQPWYLRVLSLASHKRPSELEGALFLQQVSL